MTYTIGQDYVSQFRQVQKQRAQVWNKPFEYKWYHIPIVLGAGALTITYLIAKKRKKK